MLKTLKQKGIGSLIAVDFMGKGNMKGAGFYFFLDKKVTKNQDCKINAKI